MYALLQGLCSWSTLLVIAAAVLGLLVLVLELAADNGSGNGSQNAVAT